MATTARRTVSIEELPEVLKQLSEEPIPPEVFERRRKLSTEAQKVVDEMEPLHEDVKDIICRQWGEKSIG